MQPKAILKNRAIMADSFVQVASADELAQAAATASLIVTLPLWQAQRAELLARCTPVGVLLAPADDPAAIAADLASLAVVAISFPQFIDGRGYSIARLLRQRYGYAGEIRAVGDVLRDQIFYMLCCGIDAFAMREGSDLNDALNAYNDFSNGYQSSVERTVPLFRRRREAAAASGGAA